jgi:chloride channel protein, CIC family
MEKTVNFWKKLSEKSASVVNTNLERAKMSEHFFMIICAVLIGLIAGYGAVGIRWLIEHISLLSYSGEGSVLERIIAAPWYMKIIVPAVGGLIVGPIIYFFAPEAKGHGVPEVMQAVINRNGIIRPRVAVVKAFASAVTIGTGGSVGREGPIIQIGSAIGSSLGQFFRVPAKRMKTLVACGAAAGIAAAFNAPIGGALFALEIILMEFTAAQLSPIIISSVIATVISHAYEGDIAAFQIENTYHLVTNMEVLMYFPLGALCGVIAWIFIKALYASEDWWDDKFKIPSYFKPAIGGLLIGVLAIYFPQIMGVGYSAISAALEGNLAHIATETWMVQNIWLLALILLFVKVISTSITLGSGGSGGVFAPSLFMGVMGGALYGILVHTLFPGITGGYGMYALVAMSGLVAGTTRAPLTAIIIVFEMTKEITIILPLMITVTLAMIISSKLSRESIYTLKLIQRNINIKGRADINILKNLIAKDLMDKDYLVIKENESFPVVIEKILDKRNFSLSVHTMEDKYLGLITLDNVKDVLFEKDELINILVAGDTADPFIPRIPTTMNCKEILDLMTRTNTDHLPVFDEKNPDVQLGMIRRRDIDMAYSKEVEKIDLTYNLAEKISASKEEKDVQIYEGFGLSEIAIPKEFIGKTIIELQIRNRFGVDIISITSDSKSKSHIRIVPSPDYVFEETDRIIVAGKLKDINLLKSGG